MSKPAIKKTLVAAALSLALSLQLTAPALAATDEAVLDSADAGVGYLEDNQNADGSVAGFSDVTDWVVVAVAANGQDPATFENGGDSAVDYLLAHPLTDAASATDVEKRVLAINATGQDPSDFGGVDYAALLAGYHNNGQIGDPALVNDDMFGIMAVAVSGDASLANMAQDALDYLIEHQDVSGGYGFGIDTSCMFCGVDSSITASAIVAFRSAEEMGLTNSGLSDAKYKAVAYLLSTQQTDGGFGFDALSPSDGGTTAWGLIALNSIGSGFETETAAARDWLLANQNTDGGFSYGAFGFTDSDVYTASQAVIALLGTTWLLQPEPLQHPVVTPPAETPAPATPTPQPVQTVSQPITTAPVTEEATTTTPEVLSVETKPAPTVKKQATSQKPNYMMYGGLALFVVAILWFVIQSKLKQEKG